jgi:FtsH-binding integral membrane protein
MDPQFALGDRSPGDRSKTLAWWFAGGTLLAIVASGLWTLVVGTSSPGGDEKDLVQGWEGVTRNLPGYALVVIVAGISVWFATRAIRQHAEGSQAALVASCLALFLGLVSITRDAAEVVMTTGAATVVWVLAGADLVVAGIVYAAARARSR